MTVYMVVNTGKPTAHSVARQAGDVLLSCGVDLLFDQSCEVLAREAFAGARVLPAEKAYEACDVVLSIGGDGTMLHAARFTMRHNKPLLGINIGRLGFLTAIESYELDKLRRLAEGRYIIEHRSVLRAEVEGKEDETCVALNDVVLFKEHAEKTISLDIFCDDILVSRFRGDGVIFATPTGSTAYSLSAGGPILDARLDGIVVTQICAHIVHTPPLVVASNRILRAVPNSGLAEEKIQISCDGVGRKTLEQGDSIIIRRSKWSVPLVQFADAEQLESIDKKLKGR